MREALLRPGHARTLAMLAVVTVLMVAMAAFAVSMQRRAVTSDFEPRPVFPELAERANEAQRVVIRSRKETVTVERDATDPALWRVTEKGGHPVKPQLVKRTVVGLADLELIEARTAQPEWHKHINLTDPDDKGTGVRITVYGADDIVLASLIAGKLEGSADIDGSGTIYVRRTGEDQTYVARGSFNLEQNPAAWLDTGILTLAKGRVHHVEVTPAEGEAYVVELDGEPDLAATPGPAYRIRDLDEGLEPVTDYAINGIGNALVGLSFIDVVAAEERTLEAPVTSRFVTGDGLVITAEAEKQDKLYYARFRADTTAEASEAVKAEAEALDARLGAFVYALPTAKGADLTRALDTLVQPREEGAVDLEAVADPAE